MHNTTIQNAKPGDTIRDDQVKGLMLRAFDGRKSFYLYFRTKLGVERRPKLGDYPTITLAKAREIARAKLSIVAEGRDPTLERDKAKQAPTMEEAWDRYWREHGAAKKSSSEDERMWKTILKPRLGRRRVAELSYDDMYDLHHALRDTPVQANRVIALTSKMLSLTEKWNWRPLGSNPCQHVVRNPEQARERYMAGDEAAAIATILDREEAENPDAVAFLYLLILTGARKGEIAAAQWDWLDGQVLRLPDSKTGRRNVYLPDQVMALLAKLPTNRKTITGMADPKKFWYRVRAEAGCPDLRMHDLRHSFASAALKAGLNLSQIGELLGHASTQTTKRYAHLMEDVAHASVAATANVLAGMMGR